MLDPEPIYRGLRAEQDRAALNEYERPALSPTGRFNVLAVAMLLAAFWVVVGVVVWQLA